MKEGDLERLEDMLDHAREAYERFADVTLDEYLASRDFQLISERLLEIIGEAARHVSDETRDAVELDWRRIRGLRNVISHQYPSVDHRLIHSILVERLPELVQQLEQILA